MASGKRSTVEGVAIEVRGLSKTYGRPFREPVVALDGLDITVPRGSVFGLIGPNGSGKTTLVRCLIGLTKPDSGSAALFGHDVSRSLPKVIDRVGVAFEEPVLFPGFTAIRNLEILARMRKVPKSVVGDVLEMVGLRNRASDRVRTFSLGMRQRLTLAASLLKGPDLIILDEPTNGLDPAGIVELRSVVRRLRDNGMTVFLATHQLGEAEQLCDHVVMISGGSTVAAGTLDSLLAKGKRMTCVQVSDPDLALSVLEGAGLRIEVRREYLAIDGRIDAERISGLLSDEDVQVTGYWIEKPSMESVFMDLVRHARSDQR